jgi:hypothetical protein
MLERWPSVGLVNVFVLRRVKFELLVKIVAYVLRLRERISSLMGVQCCVVKLQDSTKFKQANSPEMCGTVAHGWWWISRDWGAGPGHGT